jgi:hypothetical protein
MVGGRAQVYQLMDTETARVFALKVMLPAFRTPSLVRSASVLAQLGSLPGFESCAQVYFTPEKDPEDLARYPDLAYASLMPWIEGQTWSMVLSDSDTPLNNASSWEIAYQFVRLVRLLERHEMAHCDLSGSNIIVDVPALKVALIDFDDLYWPGAARPVTEPMGTPGYRRWTGEEGHHRLWSATGDRFALAILVAEMLAWRDETIRSMSAGDSYFTETDLESRDPPRYRALSDYLHSLNVQVGALFDRAWQARSNASCPTAEEWRAAIIEGRGWRTIPIDPLDHVRLGVEAQHGGPQPTYPTAETWVELPTVNWPVTVRTVEAKSAQPIKLGPGEMAVRRLRRFAGARGLLVLVAAISAIVLLAVLALAFASTMPGPH